MKKNFKLVLALVLSVMMIVSMVSALAVDGADMNNPSMDASIEIRGLTDGDQVNFYQVLEWKGAQGAYGGWSLTSQFAGFVTAGSFTDEAAAIRALVGDPTGNTPEQMHLTSELAGKLARISGITPVNQNPVVAANGVATLADTGDTYLGLYMALITPTDANTVYNPVFVSADYNTTNDSDHFAIATSASSYSDGGAAKKSTLTFTKVDEVDRGTSYDNTSAATRIGEKVNYTINTTIPGYGEVYQNPVFNVRDLLTDLQITADQFSAITVNGKTDAEDDHFSIARITPLPTGKTDGYVITFDPDYLKTLKAPLDIEIKYQATVTTEALKNVNTEENEASIEYSHNPSNENDHDFKKDDTNHYTFTIDADILGGFPEGIEKSGNELIKVGIDARGNPITSTWQWSEITEGAGWQGPLAGALFNLYKDDNNAKGEIYKGVDGNEYKDIASQANGHIKLTGLDAGVYWLEETKAPNGFIKYGEAIRIEIIPRYDEDKEITMYTNDGVDWSYTQDDNHKKAATYTMKVLAGYTVKVGNTDAATYTFYNEGKKQIKVSTVDTPTEAPVSVPNTQGVELPSTGGIGTTIFYVGGSILVLAAAILLITKRRMNSNE